MEQNEELIKLKLEYNALVQKTNELEEENIKLKDKETSEYEDLARIDYYIKLAKDNKLIGKKLTKEELIFNIDRVLDKYRAN